MDSSDSDRQFLLLLKSSCSMNQLENLNEDRSMTIKVKQRIWTMLPPKSDKNLKFHQTINTLLQWESGKLKCQTRSETLRQIKISYNGDSHYHEAVTFEFMFHAYQQPAYFSDGLFEHSLLWFNAILSLWLVPIKPAISERLINFSWKAQPTVGPRCSTQDRMVGALKVFSIRIQLLTLEEFKIE